MTDALLGSRLLQKNNNNNKKKFNRCLPLNTGSNETDAVNTFISRDAADTQLFR